MTGHWCDFKNTDVILHCGSNSVENHPLSSKWLNRARDNGATWIVVDPRYTRTAELADIYCPIRSGTDVAFYGGLINYIIENDLWQREYVINYTNASYLLDPGYSFDPSTGLFSGFNEESGSYSATTWHYQVESETPWDTSATGSYSWVTRPGTPEFTPPAKENVRKDLTLQDPMCVFQQMKTHYSRYDLDTVSSICGMDRDLLERVYSIYGSTGAPDKAGALLYALGQTQHTYGAQNTRAMSIVQLLLGNIGVAGGGLNALRGEPNVQGATDVGMLVNEHPAYLKWPNTTARSSLRKWLEGETYGDGYYTNKPKFLISSLKEWFGEHATVENDYGYDWLPKIPAKPDYTLMSTFELMSQNSMKGYFLWGMNPAHSAPNASFAREAMSNLDWLVVADIVETESATFWKAPGANSAEINTTVFYLPCALIYEKMGSLANSGRWLQWRYQALEPWDEAKPDYEVVDLLYKEIARLYAEEGGANPDPILKMKWDYYLDGKLDPRLVDWAFNGYTVADTNFDELRVNLLPGYSALQADGTTACAMWIYSGFWTNNDDPLNPAAQPIGSRSLEDPTQLGLYSKWAYAWPNNRRILYNRASCDPEGKPWNSEKVLVEWNGSAWVTNDSPDFTAANNGVAVPPNNNAFFMLPEQNGRLESYGMSDGPFPEHFEPFETPLSENLLNGRLNSPVLAFGKNESVKRGDADRYPIVATTYSVTEHWQSGTRTGTLPVLVEAMPTQFIEISEELAAEKGIQRGDKVRVFNNRGSIVISAVITKRLKPMTVNGEKRHLIGMTHHYGYTGMFGKDDIVNDLTPNVGDPNCFVPEFKAFLVDIEKA